MTQTFRSIQSTDELKVGDTVRVRHTTHITTVASIDRAWVCLTEKVPSHAVNQYGFWELEKEITQAYQLPVKPQTIYTTEPNHASQENNNPAG